MPVSDRHLVRIDVSRAAQRCRPKLERQRHQDSHRADLGCAPGTLPDRYGSFAHHHVHPVHHTVTHHHADPIPHPDQNSICAGHEHHLHRDTHGNPHGHPQAQLDPHPASDQYAGYHHAHPAAHRHPHPCDRYTPANPHQDAPAAAQQYLGSTHYCPSTDPHPGPEANKHATTCADEPATYESTAYRSAADYLSIGPFDQEEAQS